MNRKLSLCFALLALLAVLRLAPGEEPKKQPPVEKYNTVTEKKQPFTVLVVDPDGKPVADAHVGRTAGRMTQNGAAWHFQGIFTHTISDGIPHSDVKPAVTDANGRTQMFVDDMPRTRANLAVVARQDSRKLVGVSIVSREALLAASNNKSAITVSLQPECRVHGQVQSTDLEKLGLRLRQCAADVQLDGNLIFRFYSEQLDFEFFCPQERIRWPPMEETTPSFCGSPSRLQQRPPS